jgi:hypothetical protein
LGLDQLSIDASTEIAYFEGDLGNKFSGAGFLEKMELPADETLNSLGAGLSRLENYAPGDGGHIGRRLVWKNPGAPYRKRVLAFGNSFFERGEVPTTLSWWVARYFQEFHFIWDSVVNVDYVERMKPDVLICQTNERFLPVVPAA